MSSSKEEDNYGNSDSKVSKLSIEESEPTATSDQALGKTSSQSFNDLNEPSSDRDNSCNNTKKTEIDNRNSKKRSFEPSEENGSAEDAHIIAQHYNARPNLKTTERERSEIIHLRSFNNWVKSVLIGEFTAASRAGKILDLACGKGGDLPKWKRTRIHELVGIDIAEVSIEEARNRYAQMRPRFRADYHVFDAFHKPWDSIIRPGTEFDVISCQFAYHYSFETEESARHSIRTIAKHLRKGGYFFGTIPNFAVIKQRFQELPKDDGGGDQKIRNGIYSLRLDNDTEVREAYGQRYFFELAEAIDNCPEYFIPYSMLERIAADEGLHPCLSDPFPNFFQRFSSVPDYRDGMRRMNVVDHHNRLRLSQDELEVAELYMVFCFQRK